MSEAPSLLLSESQYLGCFIAALRRMAIALNYPTGLCSIEWLRWDDEAIGTEFANRAPSSEPSKNYDRLLVRARVEDDADPDLPQDDEDAAEYFFYGRFDFRPLKSPQRRRIEATMQAAFMELGRRGLRVPEYTAEDLGVTPIERLGHKFIASCAANYLLKNFWHNYVHNALQFISFENYRRFGGDARYEADFEADNLANLFLIHSYGLPVRACGISDPNTRKKIVHVLRCNHCNNVFALRARARQQVHTQKENEWRYRRTLSNYLSGWMAVLGFAVTSLGVYLRPTHVIVAVNGIRIAVDTPPYLESDATIRHKHFYDIAHEVGVNYSSKILEQDKLADFASHSLLSCFARAGLELTEEVMPPPSEWAQIRVQPID
jgi:hypothetical protein